ncbi:MAG: carbohydrate ABC transporter permease [Clostridia bacterium]
MRKAFWVGLCALACLPMLLPLLLLLTGSLMGQDEAIKALGSVFSGADGYARWPLLPQYPTLKGHIELMLDSPEFFAMFWNSASYAVVSLTAQAVVGGGAAWAFAMYRFPMKKPLFAAYIALMLMPFQVTMVGQYLSLDKFSLIDTRLAIILPLAFSTLPVFIMTKFFEAVPSSMLEAARIDGAGEWRIFLRVGLPLGMPGLLSAMVLGFIEAWGMIEQPMTFLRSQNLWPLALYLPQITGEAMGRALSASAIALIPPLLVFLCGQRYLEQGIGTMGIKE